MPCFRTETEYPRHEAGAIDTARPRLKGCGHDRRRRDGHVAGHAAWRADGLIDHLADAASFPGSTKCRRILCAGCFWLVTAVLMVWADAVSIVAAARGLRHGTTNMNTLVSLGTGVAFALFGLRHDLARVRIARSTSTRSC